MQQFHSSVPLNKPLKKNRVIAFALMLVVVMLSITTASVAQTAIPTPNATLNKEGIIQLPSDKPLQSRYVFDLSKMNFANDHEMIDFLSNKSGQDYSMRALTVTKQGILVLDLRNHPDWKVNDWNKYLVEHMTKTPLRR